MQMYDVAIVGYGPTGLALAAFLGRAGYRTAVFEQWPTLYTLPRAAHVDGETMRTLQRAGIARDLSERSSITRDTFYCDADGSVLAKAVAAEGVSGWEPHYSIFQPDLEILLDQSIRKSNKVDVRQGMRVQSIAQSADHVTITAAPARWDSDNEWVSEGPTEQFNARYVIGADGANSVTLVSGDFERDDFAYESLALVIFAERLDPELAQDMADCAFVIDPARPYVAFRESGKRYARWELKVFEEDDQVYMNSTEAAWAFIAKWGFTPDNARLIRHSIFRFRAMLVKDWRDKRILLAGDSAHLMPPFQGQGMCSGIRDAAALSWRLDLVLSGRASDSLLDSYTPERASHVREIIKATVREGERAWSTDPDVQEQCKAELRALTEPIQRFGGTRSLTVGVIQGKSGAAIAATGALSQQWPVRANDTKALFDDVAGTGWRLLTIDKALADNLDRSEQAVIEAVDAKVVVIQQGPGGDVDDVSGRYSRWFAQLGAKLILVRPDFYVFGAANDPESRRKLIDELREKLCLI